MNGDLATLDVQSRDAGRDPARSCIVQAPAGSGKTELLTQRVLALLARVEAPESVVAMTFTRKAAAEMRRRILDALADDTPPEAADSEHAAVTRGLAMAARANAEQRGWALTESPQRLRIQTIDGFCGALLRRSPLLSGAGGSARIRDNAAALYTEAAERVLATIDGADDTSAALRRVLLHLDHGNTRLVEMLASLLAHRDAWRGSDQNAPEAVDREALEDALARYVDATMAQATEWLTPDIRQRWYAGAEAAARKLPHNAALQAAVALGDLPQQPEEAGHWRAFCELVLTQSGTLRRTVDKRAGFPADGDARKPFLALLQQLAETSGAEAALQQLHALPAPFYDDAQWDVLQDLLLLFRRAMGELQLRFAETGEVDHGEVALRALQALGSPEAPSELLLKLDHRIQHLLVDEFQDTSDTQMELLRRLTAGWTPGDGRSLFLVGDPMQSIYRFRGANVGLFLHAWTHGVGDVALERRRLYRNFRSQAAIVDWVNTCFPALLHRDDAQSGSVAYSPSLPARDSEPGEAVHWQLCADRQAEAEAVTRICRDVPQGETAVVLLRSRGQAAPLLRALTDAGLRPQAVDIDLLAGRPAVRDLQALSRALASPFDRVAWLALLRAPFCGLHLASLQAVTTAAGEAHAPIWPVLDDPALGNALEPDQAARLARLQAALAPVVMQVGRFPLVDLVENAWLALGGPACLDGAADRQDAHRFMARLAELVGNAARPALADIDAATDRLFAAADPMADGWLQVMTMHKAKGLQFDHVILPGLSRKTGNDDKPALAQSRIVADGFELPVMAPIHAREQDGDAIFDLLHKHIEGSRATAERARLLYVAATRAVRRLHLFCEAKADKKGEALVGSGLMKDLWPGVRAELAPLLRDHLAATSGAFEVAQDEDDETAETPPHARTLRRLPVDWQPPVPPAGLSDAAEEAGEGGKDAAEKRSAPVFDWAGESARASGTLYHEWVEWLAGADLAAWDSARVEGLRPYLDSRARAFGLSETDAGEVAARVITALINTLTDPDGLWLLADHPNGHAAELALDRLEDGRLRNARIDRSFVDTEGVRWIVDYKTGGHEGGDLATFITAEIDRYRAQLEAYAHLFAAEGRPIRLALYLPLLPAGRRLVIVNP